MDMEHIRSSTISTVRGILYSPPHLCVCDSVTLDFIPLWKLSFLHMCWM